MISSSQRPLPDNTRQSQQTNIPTSVGFEPTISAGERPQTYALDRTATGTGDYINPLNAELNPICHLLALLGVHHFLHVSRIRVNISLRNTRPNTVTFKKAVIFTTNATRTSNSRFCADIMLVLSFSVIKKLNWRIRSWFSGLVERCNAIMCAFPLEANCGSGFATENWDCTVLFIRYWLNFTKEYIFSKLLGDK